MAKVLIIQRPARDKDLSSAQRYGTLQFLFEEPSFQPSQAPGLARRKIEDVLATFDPSEDYLLFLGGDWAGALIAGQVMQQMHPGKDFRILRWERERDPKGQRIQGSGFYVPALIKA